MNTSIYYKVNFISIIIYYLWFYTTSGLSFCFRISFYLGHLLFVVLIEGLLELPSLLLTGLEGCAAIEVLDVALDIQIDVA